MSLPRLFRTSSFRLTLLYAGLISASVIVLFAVIYWSATFYMTDQLDSAIGSDLTELRDGFREGGLQHLAALIDGRVSQMPSGPILYLLEDRDGRVLAGNLPSLPVHSGTFAVELPPRGLGRRVRAVRARGVHLPGGNYLLVGTNAYPLDELREVIWRAFGWSFAVTLLLAFGGGAVMSGRVLRRVETISRTARAMIDGNLARRIPMRGADDEFDHLAASLNVMLERMEGSIEALRQVSNDIAHDLRTPLTRLRQRLELASRRPASVAELRTAIGDSIADADAILETFGALLRIAQIETGGPRDRLTAIDLSDLLQTVREVYQPMAEEKRQHLAADIAPGLDVCGDRELLAQMFANLIENALRHSPPEAAVTLAAHLRPEGIEVAVADTGPGIPESEYRNVFRRFYRLEASRTTPGNGLGLSLVAAIARLHGLALQLSDNRPGLRVSMRFRPQPRLAAPAPAAAGGSSAPAEDAAEVLSSSLSWGKDSLNEASMRRPAAGDSIDASPVSD